MQNDKHFWWTTLVRGFVALIAGSAIMVIPEMARTLLLLPIAIAISILGLAVYGVLDSVLVFVTSYMATSRPAKFVLRLQGVIGVTVGILLYRVFFFHVQLHWFLILIVIQSLSTAIAEFLIARHSRTRATSRWNFTDAAVAFGFSCVYFYIVLALADRMVPQKISWLIYGYLVAFGIAQCLTAARMLYADQHA
jgi:uncharacterized membrane protein HdeD (DUF308 family)